jgi:hypothetical protein
MAHCDSTSVTPKTPTTVMTAEPAKDQTSPSDDTLPKTHVNALKMQKNRVFDESYYSDGYIGPLPEEQILLNWRH